MPKLIRENPAYFIVPVFVLIIGAVFFWAEDKSQAKEWERLGSPAGFTQGRLSDITAYYDAENNRYLAWAVGGGFLSGTVHDNDLEVPIIMSYNSQAGAWAGLFANKFSSVTEVKLNAISNVVKITSGNELLWAVGDGGIIFYTSLPGNQWYVSYKQLTTCTSTEIQNSFSGALFTTDNLTDVSFTNAGTNSRGWATSYDPATKKGDIYESSNQNLCWNPVTYASGSSRPSVPFLALHMIDNSTGWAVGGNSIIYNKSGISWAKTSFSPIDYGPCQPSGFCAGNSEWACETVTANKTWKNDCIMDFYDVFFTSDGKGYIPISSRKYLYYDGSSWNQRDTYRPASEPETKMYAVSGGLDNGTPYIWFSGDKGMTIFSANANNNPSHWSRQSVPKLENGRLYGMSSLDLTHTWSAGYFQSATAGQLSDNVALKLSPGNAAGYAYVGGDNCDNFCVDIGGSCQTNLLTKTCADGTPRQAPMGWISFNCLNNGSCESNTFSYGVDLKKETETADTQNSCVARDPAPSFQDKDVGALSGQAWLGVTDPNERSDATCFSVVCSNNNSLTCDDDDDCALCANNPKSCFSAGWLSFNRDETGEPPACPYQFKISNVCPDSGFNSFNTPCGKTISAGDYEDNAMAFFDYQSYALTGWGRFKLGQCSSHQDTACYKNDECKFCILGEYAGKACLSGADCGTGFCISENCEYKNKDFADAPAAGWLKLRGGQNFSPANPPAPPEINNPTDQYIYHNCNACTLSNPDTVNAFMTCKICDGLNIDVTKPGENYACNVCDGSNNQCGDGRCEGKPEEVCVVNEDPLKDHCQDIGQGDCIPSGYCSSSSPELFRYRPCLGNSDCNGGICKRGNCSNIPSNPCYNSNDCGAGTCEIINYISCNKCESCDAYGVSADINAGNFYGYAWSEDFGWVDMSRVSLAGAAWLQTLYGDIYGQKGVGSQEMAKAPGYKEEGNACNATYLILAGDTGRIVNFCSSSQGSASTRLNPSFLLPQSSANPWLVQNYRKFTLPVNTAPNSILGRVDYNDMISKCSQTYSGSLSTGPGYFGGNDIDLNGRVICIRDKNDYAGFHPGDLTLTSGLIFKNGLVDGSGLFVVDGDLIIESNINYKATNVDNLKKLASLAFYVKGNIYIGPSVDTLVGAYYSEKKIIVQSMGSADKKLTAYGLMIAKEFGFGRRYKGTISSPEPSELFIYDGRVQLNPPPGFRDLSQALPKISEVSP
ncbi:MAG: hypothetical protein ABIH38_03025 [Patescibacteria group bacterium]